MVERKEGTRRKVVFVTGAHGNLGMELVKALLKEGNTVRALIRSNIHTSHMPPGTIPFLGNVEDRHVLDSACEGADVVYHLAAVFKAEKHMMAELMRVNVDGTRNVVEACKKNGVKHLIFASTDDVYDTKSGETLKETTQPMPRDKYGYSKLLAEKEIISSGVPYTILRICTIYGPPFKQSFFKIFRAIHEGKIVVIGSGKNHLTLVHSDDVVRALLLVKNDNRSINKIYNLGDGVAYTQQQLFDTAAKMMGVPAPKRHVTELLVRVLAKQRRLESDELRFLTANRVLDISKISSELGFEPKVKMEQGGKELVDLFIETCGKRRRQEMVAWR